MTRVWHRGGGVLWGSSSAHSKRRTELATCWQRRAAGTDGQVLSGMAQGNGTMKPVGDSYGGQEAEVGTRWDLPSSGNIDRIVLVGNQLSQI